MSETLVARLVCEICGSHGEGGEIEYSDGTRRHFTNMNAWKDGKLHPILCSGKFIGRVPETPGKEGE
jgi:hypothetical protein